MRLIDADWVLDALGVFNDRKHGDAHFFNGIASAEEVVEHAPTIATRGWTPCAERLPDAFDGEPKDAPWYLCSNKNGTRCILIYQKCGAVDDWRTITGLGISDSVIAYMLLPAPYRADDTTGKVDHIVDNPHKV